MRYAIPILIIVWLGMFLTACHSNKTASVSSTSATDSLLSVHLREIVSQSITKQREKDSMALERVVVIKDSVVHTTDTAGNIIKSERFRSTDSNTNRESVTNRDSQSVSNKELKDSVTDNHKSVAIARNETTIAPSEKKLSWWERTTNAISDIIMIATILIVIGGIIWLIRKIFLFS